MRFSDGKLFTLITVISLFFIAGCCCGNNPVDQLLDFLKNEVIPVIDEEPNHNTTEDTCMGANDFSGCWSINQSNGEAGTIALIQVDCSVSGTASLYSKENGTISGKANGSIIDFTVTYSDGKKVTYSSMLNDDVSSISSGKGISSDGESFTWSASKGECQVVSVDGCWAVEQSNNHIGIITLKQNGSAITGTSGWTTHSNGPVNGSVEGTRLTFTISYPEGVTGCYSATISNDKLSLVNGITKSSTGDQAQWNAKKTVCDQQSGCHKLSKDQYTLALYYFDETDGISLIDETRKTSGKLTGGIRVSGKCGNALQFKPGEYATFDTILPNNLPEGTIELSVKFDSDFDPTKVYSIFGNDGSRIQIIYKSGSILFSKNHSDVYRYTQSAFTFAPDKWYDIAATWGSRGMRIFIDGKQVAANTDCTGYQVSPRTTAENIFYIGKKSWCCMIGFGISSDLSFKGSVDEIRVSSVMRY